MRTTTYSYIQRYTYFSGKGFSRLYYRSNARLSCTQIHDRLESEPRSLNFARKHQLRDQGEQQVQWHGFGIKPFLKRVGVTNIIEFILTCRKNEQTQCEDAFALCDRLDLIGIELAEHLHNNFGMAGMIGRLEFHEVLTLWNLLCLVATPSIFDPRFVWFDWKLCWCWIAKFHGMPGLYFLAGILEIKSLKCLSCWKWQKICLNEMWLSL